MSFLKVLILNLLLSCPFLAVAQDDSAQQLEEQMENQLEGQLENQLENPAEDPSDAPSDAATDLGSQTKVRDQKRPFSEILEEVIAQSYIESAFEWRKSPFILQADFGQPIELNNYSSNRFGLIGLLPVGSILLGIELSGIRTRSTASSLLLEETPIRQVGRPSRLELGAIFELPLAEGAANQLLSVLPASQMMWSFQFRLRKLYYDGMYRNQKGLGLLRALIAPKLSDGQQNDIKDSRLPGMTISEDTIDLLAGLKATIFHSTGAFLSPSFLLSLPLLSGGAARSLGFWWEMTLGFGYAF